MKNNYEDIISRLGEPLWYDENGVPRYEQFNPELATVYGQYAAYMIIACQACGKKFNVAVTAEKMTLVAGRFVEVNLPNKDDEGWFCYGDPPPHGCVGDTMSSETVKILEFWVRDPSTGFEWVRKQEYEFEYPYDGVPEEAKKEAKQNG